MKIAIQIKGGGSPTKGKPDKSGYAPTVFIPMKNERLLEINVPDGETLSFAIKSVHMAISNRDNPKVLWVQALDDEAKLIAQVIASDFGCPIKDNSEEGGISVGLLLWLLMPMLRTDAGRDWQARRMGDTSATDNAASYVGLTENATAPAVGDTTLTGELNAVGGGLNRKQLTYSHAVGEQTYTLSGTFTIAAADGPPRTISKMGVFDDTFANGGTMVFENLLNSPPPLDIDGPLADELFLLETVDLGANT